MIKLKPILISLLLMTVFLIAGCGKNSDKPILLKCGHGMKKKHPVSIAIRYFAVQAYEMSKGKILIKIFPDEDLGSENELVKKVQKGELDLVKISASDLSNIIPDYSVLGLPYLYENDKQYFNVLNGPIGEAILKSGDKYGLMGLTFYYAGARSFYTKNKIIRTPADLKGMKIRVQPNAGAEEMLKLLGAVPVPLPYGKVYAALEKGEVDGAENNIPSFYSNRNFELCRYYSYDKHTKIPDVLLINQKRWKSLSDAEQRILKDAAKKSFHLQIEIWKNYKRRDVEIMKINGVKFNKVDEKAFYEKVESMYSKLDQATKEIVRKIRDTESSND